MSIKKPSNRSVGRGSVTAITVRCGNCAHHCKLPHPTLGKPCRDLGIEKFAEPCKVFYPDLSMLARIEGDSLLTLARAASRMDEDQLRLLSYVFSSASLLSRMPFKFGQPVFFNMSSPVHDYLECYYSGYVVGPAHDGEHVHVAGDLSSGRTAHMILPPSALMSKSEFTRHRQHLIDSGRERMPKDLQHCLLVNPKFLSRALKKRKEYVHDVPTLDTVDPSWIDKVESSLKKKKRGKSKTTSSRSPRRSGRQLSAESIFEV